MDNTLFSKCEILQDAYNDLHGMSEWDDFFSKNDLGVFAAVTHVAGSTTLTEIGQSDVISAYNSLCNAIGVDPNDSYSTLDQMME